MSKKPVSKIKSQCLTPEIDRIEEYSKDHSFESLSRNRMVIDAIIRNFEIIGEAAAILNSIMSIMRFGPERLAGQACSG